MTTTVKATYTNGVLAPLEPLDLKEGEQVTVSIEAPPDGAAAGEARGESLVEMFDRLRKSVPADTWDDLPSDLTKNKKHYLYGHPKEGE